MLNDNVLHLVLWLCTGGVGFIAGGAAILVAKRRLRLTAPQV